MRVCDNPWFGVRPRDDITILWYYLSRAEQWVSELRSDVRALLSKTLPHYSTSAESQLPAEDINLLAHYAAWVVTTPESIRHIKTLLER